MGRGGGYLSTHWHSLENEKEMHRISYLKLYNIYIKIISSDLEDPSVVPQVYTAASNTCSTCYISQV